jgi:hypothetical protein
MSNKTNRNHGSVKRQSFLVANLCYLIMFMHKCLLYLSARWTSRPSFIHASFWMNEFPWTNPLEIVYKSQFTDSVNFPICKCVEFCSWWMKMPSLVSGTHNTLIKQMCRAVLSPTQERGRGDTIFTFTPFQKCALLYVVLRMLAFSAFYSCHSCVRVRSLWVEEYFPIIHKFIHFVKEIDKPN